MNYEYLLLLENVPPPQELARGHMNRGQEELRTRDCIKVLSGRGWRR